ncbi:MAG: hypothetical protein RIC11_17785 [Botrimarina sp.]
MAFSAAFTPPAFRSYYDGGAVIVNEAAFLTIAAYAAGRCTCGSSDTRRFVGVAIASVCLGGAGALALFWWHIVENLDPLA